MFKIKKADNGWRKKGTATKLLSVHEKMLTDERRVQFEKGTWWHTAIKIEGMQEGEEKNTQLGCLVARFVEYLTSNEFYFLRNCWDNTSLCKYYRSYASYLYWSCKDGGRADLCDLFEYDVFLILKTHKDDMDDLDNPKYKWVDFSDVRDNMMTSMRRLRRWLDKTS